MFREGSKSGAMCSMLMAGLMLTWSMWCCCALHADSHNPADAAATASLIEASWQAAPGSHNCCASQNAPEKSSSQEQPTPPSHETSGGGGCDCHLLMTANTNAADTATLSLIFGHSMGSAGMFLPVHASWQTGLWHVASTARRPDIIPPPRNGLTLVAQACLLTI